MHDKNPVSSGEEVKSKSPAEFFADNQNIAGFDNVRKLLNTAVVRGMRGGVVSSRFMY